jgi:hypothetical protein
MNAETHEKLLKAKEITEELLSAVDNINTLLNHAADLGMQVYIEKDEAHDGKILKTKLRLKNASVTIEFAQQQVIKHRF